MLLFTRREESPAVGGSLSRQAGDKDVLLTLLSPTDGVSGSVRKGHHRKCQSLTFISLMEQSTVAGPLITPPKGMSASEQKTMAPCHMCSDMSQETKCTAGLRADV